MTMMTFDQFSASAVRTQPGNQVADQSAGASIPDKYIEGALRTATIREISKGEWVAEVPGFDGVWSDGRTPGEAVEGLHDVLCGWVLLKITDNDDDIPAIDGIKPGLH